MMIEEPGIQTRREELGAREEGLEIWGWWGARFTITDSRIPLFSCNCSLKFKVYEFSKSEDITRPHHKPCLSTPSWIALGPFEQGEPID